ncbi:MAG TPA: tetratricopeptide repeat protein [Casimicrobiaceae bacterium]|jgi:tetratricopeptide (TPR) repeat protein
MPSFLRHGARLATLMALLAAGAHAQSPLPADEPPAATRVPEQSPAPADGGGLTADLFYKILLADVALQRGDVALAARAYLDAAREAQDVRLARRATEVALAARQRDLANDAAQLWSTLDPQAERPRRIITALASGQSGGALADPGTDDLRTRLEKLLADAAVSGQGVGEVFMQLNRAFAQQSDKRAVLALIRDLAKPYAKTPEAHFAVALAAYNAIGDDADLATDAQHEIDEALTLRPDWERAALLKSEILGRHVPGDAAGYLEKFLAAHPDSKPVAGALAQLYVDQKRYTDARAVLQRLLDRDPDAHDVMFGIAAVDMQMKDYAGAEELLQKLKKAGYGEQGVVDLYLAQVAEESKRYDEAIARYREITEGDRAWVAKLRIGALYGKMGRLDEARRWFADLPAVTIEQRVQVKQAEAQMLREAGDDAGAYRVLSDGLNDQPESTELMYDLAMVAEKLNRIDEAEKRLSKLVELKPDDAQALNALGYTLVDRTPRTQEGFELIEKAHKLSPADPFILDSMGWALFRLGRLQEAEDYLRRALAQRTDPEIAAHLGEVLWQKGDRDTARAIWQPQLESNPDNAVLKETIRRLSR